MKKKKVLITATVDVHIRSFHLPYLKLFKDMEYEVHVATNGNEEFENCDVKHVVSFERNPLKLKNLKAIKELKKIIEEENFDIIHCHTPMGGVVTRLAARKARKNGTRVIYTAHGFHFYKGAPLLNWLIYYPIEKILSYITDDLITINNEDYDLAKNKFHAKRIHYVPGVGVDPEKFNFELSKEEKHNLRESLGVKDDDFVMIYVAELNKNKNQSMAIMAMRELVKENENIKLLLVGKDSYNGKYQQLVKDNNLENNIVFTGYKNNVPKLMKISDIAISTSKREGLPVNLIEANICGLQIIATNCRGNRDLVDEKNKIEFNEEDLVNKIKEYLQSDFRDGVEIKEQYKMKNILKKYQYIYERS